MMVAFASGWCLVKLADESTAVLFVRPLHLRAPSPPPYIIAHRSATDADGIPTCEFFAPLDQFEREILIKRVAAQAVFDWSGDE